MSARGRALLATALALSGCSSTPTNADGGPEDASVADAPSDGQTAGDGPQSPADASDAGTPWVDTLASNRDRLLATYFAFLKASAVQPQSNGLSQANVASVCDVWKKLDPSSQSVFLTLTARMQGGKLDDGSSMLWHVTKLYRAVGGQGATANDPGSCGGAEYNRMIMAKDQRLHDALLAANANKGAKNAKNAFDISDIPANTSWRDSRDLGGPHAPFDLSDETDQGAPRGQVHFFQDATSALAKTALGRMDLGTLVDPMALEMDQDYDCVHASNPMCSYITYGALCVPMASKVGTDLFAQNYGSFDASWQPAGCK